MADELTGKGPFRRAAFSTCGRQVQCGKFELFLFFAAAARQPSAAPAAGLNEP